MKALKPLVSYIYANRDLIMVLVAVMALCIVLFLAYTAMPLHGRM